MRGRCSVVLAAKELGTNIRYKLTGNIQIIALQILEAGNGSVLLSRINAFLSGIAVVPSNCFVAISRLIVVASKIFPVQSPYSRTHYRHLSSSISPKLTPTLRAQDSSRLRIQSLQYRSQGPLGKDYFRTTIFFPANFVTLLAVI